MKKMRVSEKVTIEEINKWNAEDIITIKAGCGAGKSYFIKNNLYAIAKRDNKKILMLIHRSNCTNQFIEEIKNDDPSKFDNITIETYQYIEAKERIKGDVNLKEYDYIICDEFHYFMGDASFNKFTDMSLDIILAATHAKRIFLSATGDYMRNYMSNVKKLPTIDYELPIDFSFINYLEFYHSNETLHRYIELAIKNNAKSIFFIQSAKRAYELYEKYKEYSLFNCSKSNNEYYQYVDEGKIKTMLDNERFEELILFTTTCMDAGVNIFDNELHDIVIDVGLDVGVIQQCLGRKRFDEKFPDDYVNVYIKSMSNKQLGGKQTQLMKKIEMADYFRRHGTNATIEKYYREVDKGNMIYDQVNNFGYEKKLNNLMYFNVMTTLAEVEKMKSYGDWGFCKYVADYFNIKNYKVAEMESNKNKLTTYLDSIVGKQLFKDEQEELKMMFKENGLSARTMGINTLNGNLMDRKLPYLIVNKRGSQRVDGKVKSFTYWEVVGDVCKNIL